jgi:DNA-binding CsgD family transcriptional regulator
MKELNFQDKLWVFACLFSILLVQVAAVFSVSSRTAAALASALIALVALGILWIQGMKTHRMLHSWEQAIVKTDPSWKSTHKAMLDEFRMAVDRQLNLWKLNASEREAALYLIGGYSTKDIAAARRISEREALSLSLSIFAKSGLPDRHALSAFFLPFTKSLKYSDDKT